VKGRQAALVRERQPVAEIWRGESGGLVEVGELPADPVSGSHISREAFGLRRLQRLSIFPSIRSLT